MSIETHLGRTSVAISIGIGLFMYSFIVLSVKNTIELDDDEVKLTSIINYNTKIKPKLKCNAIIFIQR